MREENANNNKESCLNFSSPVTRRSDFRNSPAATVCFCVCVCVCVCICFVEYPLPSKGVSTHFFFCRLHRNYALFSSLLSLHTYTHIYTYINMCIYTDLIRFTHSWLFFFFLIRAPCNDGRRTCVETEYGGDATSVAAVSSTRVSVSPHCARCYSVSDLDA